jgi:hypothetical protein
MIVQDIALLNGETAWINLAQTARLLGVDRSTLSKQAHAGRVRYEKLGLGRGQLVVSPAEVLRLADIYRRVPMREVKKNLAHELAVYMSSDEETVIRALDELHASVTEASAQSRQPEDDVITAVRSTRVDRAEGRSMETSTEPSATVSVINLGRLHPRRMQDEDVPSETLLQAIDRRHPQQPNMQIVDSNSPIIDLGRLRPGKRL